MNSKLLLRLNYFVSVCSFVLLIFFMIPRNDPTESVRRTMVFCGGTLVPSLFMSTVLGKIVASGRSIRKNPSNIKVLIYGLACGFPFGAICADELYKNGCISYEQAEMMTATSNSASASFIVTYVGTSLLGSVKTGLFLLVGNVAASVLWYIILKKCDGNTDMSQIYTKAKIKSVAALIAESAQTLLSVCGCVIFFTVISEAFGGGFNNNVINSLIHGFFEISGGMREAARLKPGDAYVVSAILVGWSGISVIMQVAIAADGIKIGRFVLGRVFQAALMGIYAIATKEYVI